MNAPTLPPTGERQVSPTLDGIAPDHRKRYEWAADRILRAYRSDETLTVVDAGCGNGYGSFILASAGFKVVAVDRSHEAVAFARAHYAHPNITHVVADLEDGPLPNAHAVVCFEVLEHLRAEVVMPLLVGCAPVLCTSVPNEVAVPFDPERFPFHLRHYTPDQFAQILADWVVVDPVSQADKWTGDVAPGWVGRTLLAFGWRRTNPATELRKAA